MNIRHAGTMLLRANVDHVCRVHSAQSADGGNYWREYWLGLGGEVSDRDVELSVSRSGSCSRRLFRSFLSLELSVRFVWGACMGRAVYYSAALTWWRAEVGFVSGSWGFLVVEINEGELLKWSRREGLLVGPFQTFFKSHFVFGPHGPPFGPKIFSYEGRAPEGSLHDQKLVHMENRHEIIFWFLSALLVAACGQCSSALSDGVSTTTCNGNAVQVGPIEAAVSRVFRLHLSWSPQAALPHTSTCSATFATALDATPTLCLLGMFHLKTATAIVHRLLVKYCGGRAQSRAHAPAPIFF